LLSDNQVTLLPESVDDTAAVLEALREPGGISDDDLDKLLLAKHLLEQALIYARYHAKALENKGGGQE
ncbi:MAG: hypothetical protein GX601_12260, partial [Anaerolineales bacterium]|nr:hypothetical protein [Anaerolineales bacterium]